MQNTSFKMPFCAKAAPIFISMFAQLYCLYINHGIIIPIVYGTITAILMNPLVNYIVKKNATGNLP